MVEHPIGESTFIAGTTTGDVIEIGSQGECYLLAAGTGNGSSADSCSAKQQCNYSFSKVFSHVIQLFHYQLSNPSDDFIFVLDNSGLWRLNVNNCSVRVSYAAPGLTPLFVTRACSAANVVTLVLSQSDSTGILHHRVIKWDVLNDVFVGEEQRSLLSKYLLPVVNHNCSLKLEINLNDTSTFDLNKYAWFKSHLLYKSTDHSGLRLYRSLSRQPVTLRWTPSFSFTSHINVINTAHDGETLLVYSNRLTNKNFGTKRLLVFQEDKLQPSNHRKFFLKKQYKCAPKPALTYYALTQIEACTYKCMLSLYCRGLMFYTSSGRTVCDVFRHIALEMKADSDCYILD